ncbi:MAG: hypothetical protein HY207_09405 [Nitrospirae bacterium]|nr:hypothetical protein [Nitrospirota bacterium]
MLMDEHRGILTKGNTERIIPESVIVSLSVASLDISIGPPARCSHIGLPTDPEAPVMKMADGGFLPAFNVQAVTDTESQVIVGVSVVTSTTDQGHVLKLTSEVGIGWLARGPGSITPIDLVLPPTDHTSRSQGHQSLPRHPVTT